MHSRRSSILQMSVLARALPGALCRSSPAKLQAAAAAAVAAAMPPSFMSAAPAIAQSMAIGGEWFMVPAAAGGKLTAEDAVVQYPAAAAAPCPGTVAHSSSVTTGTRCRILWLLRPRYQ